MRLLLAVTTALFFTLPLSAQATTGQHQAEASPDFAYSGTGWIQVVDGDYIVMESTEPGDSVAFSFDGGSVMVMRTLFVTDGAAIEVCIDAICKPITNSSTMNDLVRMPIALQAPGDAPHTLTITNTDGGRFQIDDVMVFSAPPWPELQELELDPSKEYFAIGDRMVAVDFLITGGEIAVTIFLAFISVVLVTIALILRFHRG